MYANLTADLGLNEKRVAAKMQRPVEFRTPTGIDPYGYIKSSEDDVFVERSGSASEQRIQLKDLNELSE